MEGNVSEKKANQNLNKVFVPNISKNSWKILKSESVELMALLVVLGCTPRIIITY